jgi:hypothetical protein
MANGRKFPFEYEHHKLSPDVHFGKHTLYGRHLAIGTGEDTIHIYPTKLHFGGKDGQSLPLTAAQSLQVVRLLNKIERSLMPVPTSPKPQYMVMPTFSSSPIKPPKKRPTDAS